MDAQINVFALQENPITLVIVRLVQLVFVLCIVSCKVRKVAILVSLANSVLLGFEKSGKLEPRTLQHGSDVYFSFGQSPMWKAP
jgi:hypothetical protein